LTGGLIKAGFHEVVVNERTLTVRMVYCGLDVVPDSSDRLLRTAKCKTQIDRSFAYRQLSSGISPLTMILHPFRDLLLGESLSGMSRSN
jgi:hypothetical protein